MRCIALARGHDGSELRDEGVIFEVDDERIGKDGKPKDGSTWFIACKDDDRPKPKS